jgi:GNAT superfamily N-acetyltransferase
MTAEKDNTTAAGRHLPPSTRVEGAEPPVILLTAKATLAAGDGMPHADRHPGKREPLTLQPVRAAEQPPGLRQDHRARTHVRPAPRRPDLRRRLPARQHRMRPARRTRPGSGTRLVEAVLGYADGHGFARVVLSPSQRAILLYRRAGFGPADALLSREHPSG